MRIGAAHHLIPYSLWRVTLKIYAELNHCGPHYYELRNLDGQLFWCHTYNPDHVNVKLSGIYRFSHLFGHTSQVTLILMNQRVNTAIPFHPLHLTRYCWLYCNVSLLLFILNIPLYYTLTILKLAANIMIELSGVIYAISKLLFPTKRRKNLYHS